MVVRIIHVLQNEEFLEGKQVAVHFENEGEEFSYEVWQEGNLLKTGKCRHLQFPSVMLARQILKTVKVLVIHQHVKENR